MSSPIQLNSILSDKPIPGITKNKSLFVESEFPKEGWIQICFICALEPTSHLLDYNTIKNYKRITQETTNGSSNFNMNTYNLNILIHSCGRCSQKLKDDKVFNKNINRFINKHICTNIYPDFIAQ